MKAPVTRQDGATLAVFDAVQVQEATGHAFNLLRLVVADMERESHADRADNGLVEMWAGVLRWLVTTLDDRNDELRDRYLEAGWLQQPETSR